MCVGLVAEVAAAAHDQFVDPDVLAMLHSHRRVPAVDVLL